MFAPYIYDIMIENEEMWYVFGWARATQISDASLMDC